MGRRLRPVRLGVAAGVAALVSLVVRSSLPEGLHVRTDVVGYPIHRNFDVYGYFRTYDVVVVLFPLLTLAACVALGWRPASGPRSGGIREVCQLSTAEAVPGEASTRAGLGRSLFVGAVIGLEVAFILQVSRWFWLVVVACATGYTVVIFLGSAARLIPSPVGTAGGRRAVANAVSVRFTFLLLYWVSASARVSVVADGSVRHHPWMPLWLAAGAGMALLGFTLRAIVRARSDDELRRIERRAVVLVAGSAGVFLLIAGLPGPVAGLDFFHDGESLAAADLILHGAFPWRDVLFVHGLVEDVAHSGLGMWVFRNDIWGALAGQSALLGPVHWVSLYLLNVYLFGRNWLFLVLTTSLVLQGWLTPELNRFVLVPYLLLVLAALLRKPTRVRAAGFVLLGLANVVITPESAFAVLAAGSTVVAFELWYREPERGLKHNFRRTIWCASTSVIAVGAWCAYLARYRALGSFFFYFRAFVPDHVLTGGIPLSGTGFDFWFAVVAPPAVALLFLWRFGARLAARRRVAVADWVMASVAVFVLLYVRKFLSRADAHVFHVLAASLPLLYYALHLLVDAAESALSRQRWGTRIGGVTTRHPVTLVLVVLVIAMTPGAPLGNAYQRIPHSWDVAVPEEQPRWGYTTGTATDAGLQNDLSLVLDAVVGPTDRVFDMTNSPALFHYLLGTRPATRYYHLSTAIRREVQRDLIGALRRVRPKVVVLDGGYGLPNWDDIPGTVRHYEVGEYVLRRYRPLVWVRSYLLLIRSDAESPPLGTLAPKLTQPIGTENLLADSRPCDWGTAPEFLADRPSSASPTADVSLPFTLTRSGGGQEVSIRVPDDVDLKRFSHLVIDTGAPLRDDTFALSHPGSKSPITFRSIGRQETRYRVRVGSCPQWYAYSGPELRLRSDRREDITGIRLQR